MLPHDTVSACPGEQLIFMCTTNATSIRWSVTVPLLDTFHNSGSEIVSHVQTRMVSPIRINSNISFTISRLSTSGTLPLISTLSVTDLMNVLNGTRVECFTRIDNVDFQRMTTIYVIRSGGNGKQMKKITIASYPGASRGGGERAWRYILHAHAPEDPRKK